MDSLGTDDGVRFNPYETDPAKPVNSSQPLVVLGFSSPDQRHQLLIFDSVWGASKEWAGSAQLGKLLCSRTLRGALPHKGTPLQLPILSLDPKVREDAPVGAWKEVVAHPTLPSTRTWDESW